MSKRFGNITTARDLREDGVDPGAIRLLIYQTHYRQKLDLTDTALAAAGEGSGGSASSRAGSTAAADRTMPGLSPRPTPDQGSRPRWTTTSTPAALAALHVLVREANRLMDEGKRVRPAMRAAWELADGVLAVAPSARARTVSADDLAVAEEDGIPVSGRRRSRRSIRPTWRLGRCAGRRSGRPKNGPETSSRRIESGVV